MAYENFYQAYKDSPTNIKVLLDSDRIGEFVEKDFIQKYNMESKMKQKLIVLISNIIAGFDAVTELDRVLPYIFDHTVNIEEVSSEIQDFIKRESDSSQGSLASEIQQLEDTVSQLDPIRTYATDLKAHESDTPAHSSSQDELLQHQPEIGGAPRWGSDEGS